MIDRFSCASRLARSDGNRKRGAPGGTRTPNFQIRSLSLYPIDEAGCSPTVTALKVPESLAWEELDRRLRGYGMGVGGSLGPLAGQVFRIGHMGAQADLALVDRGMDVLAQCLSEVPSSPAKR